MSDGATRTDLEQWVRAFAQQVEENKDLLTELDAAIGDADHGANMDRGLKAVLVALEQDPPATPATLFNKVGLTLVSTVGGASGPLYGTLFLRFGGGVGGGGAGVTAAVRGGTASRTRRRGRPRQGRARRQDDVRRPGPGSR